MSSAKDAQSFLSFQDLILRLQQYWAERGCVLQQPYDLEIGAGLGAAMSGTG